MKTFQKINNKFDFSQPESIKTEPPVCGQIISFYVDHSIRLTNPGNSVWTNVDNCEWLIDQSILVLKSLDPHSFSSMQFIIGLIDDNMIVLRSTERIGIETGVSSVSVWTLEKVN